MPGFTVLIDKDHKEELYSDIAPEFLSFFLIEAIVLICTDPHKLPIVDDPTNYCDDPDGAFDNSVSFLLDLWSESDREAGVLLEGEFYEYNSDHHEQVCLKLHQAIAAIQDVNDTLSLLLIKQTLADPTYAKAYTFTTMHLPDRVVFILQPQPMGFPLP